MIKAELKTEHGVEKFYYSVDVFIGTFDVYPSYSFNEAFGDKNLRSAKSKAIQRAKELEMILQYQGMFFLPFASPKEFVHGENACYSICVSLVQEFDEDNELEYQIHTIKGGDDDENTEALLFETDIFEQLTNCKN